MKKRIIKEDRQWCRVLQENLPPMIMHLTADQRDIEGLNRAQLYMRKVSPNLDWELFLSITPLSREDALALDLCDWEKKESLKFLQTIIAQIEQGHYNDRLKGLAIESVRAEYSDGPERQALIKKLESLPSRSNCGAIEAWCEAGFGNCAVTRFGQIQTLGRILERIKASYGGAQSSPAATPASRNLQELVPGPRPDAREPARGDV